MASQIVGGTIGHNVFYGNGVGDIVHGYVGNDLLNAKADPTFSQRCLAGRAFPTFDVSDPFP